MVASDIMIDDLEIIWLYERTLLMKVNIIISNIRMITNFIEILSIKLLLIAHEE